MTLTSRWGRYAWQEMMPFNIDNHLIISNGTYRGRAVTNMNIQESIYEWHEHNFLASLNFLIMLAGMCQ